MATIANLEKFFKNDVILIPTYGGFHTNDDPSNLELYISNDCKTAYNINIEDIFTSETGKGQWDISGNYYNGEFLMVSDFDSNSDGSGGDTINFIATADFETYREWQVNLPSQYTKVWAPELFIDSNGDVYIFVSLCLNDATAVNVDGSTVPYFETYYIKAIILL